LGGVVAVSAVVALFLWREPVPVSHARLYKDGELFREINMHDVTVPFTYTVSGVDGRSVGGRNEVEVEYGRIRVIKSDCGFGICILRGWASGGRPIVCLPNRFVIKFEDFSGQGIDAVVG